MFVYIRFGLLLACHVVTFQCLMSKWQWTGIILVDWLVIKLEFILILKALNPSIQLYLRPIQYKLIIFFSDTPIQSISCCHLHSYSDTPIQSNLSISCTFLFSYRHSIHLIYSVPFCPILSGYLVPKFTRAPVFPPLFWWNGNWDCN